MELTYRWGNVARGRTLFIAMAYHGNDRDSRPGFFGRFESPGARGHRIVHRNHYANPRPAGYVLAMIATAARQISEDAADLVVDTALPDVTPDMTEGFRRVTTADPLSLETWANGALSCISSYDQIVLVYCDALGLGCEAAEAAALARHARVLVINGRRRAFRLEGSMQVQLAAHRFLAHTRLVERTLGAVLRRVGGALAMLDRRS